MGQMKVIETTLGDVVMIYDRSGEPICHAGMGINYQRWSEIIVTG